VSIPVLSQPQDALRAVIGQRLRDAPPLTVDEVMENGAILALASLYERTEGNLREVLAVLQFALDGAVDDSAAKLTPAHIRYGVSAALPRHSPGW
jgi:Cdc6-like AAA superfamily ATPase